MPRPLELVVEPYPVLSPGKPYRMRVISLRKERSALRAAIEHIAEEQAGRELQVDLPLPVRPGNPTARVLAALGFDTRIGATLRPAEAVCRELLVEFSSSSEGEEPQPVAFHPIPEKHHAQHAE